MNLHSKFFDFDWNQVFKQSGASVAVDQYWMVLKEALQSTGLSAGIFRQVFVKFML